MKKKGIMIAAVLVIMIGSVVVATLNKPKTVETIGGYKGGTRVEVEYVKQQDIASKISSSGQLEAEETTTIYLDATNRIKTLNKENGDSVKSGECILTLDQEVKITSQKQLEALYKQLEAAKNGLNQLTGVNNKGDILSAKAGLSQLLDSKSQLETNIQSTKQAVETLNEQLSDAKKDLSMNQSLFEEGLLSEKALSDLELNVSDLTNKVTQNKSNLKNLETSLGTINLQIQSAQYNVDVLLNKVSDSNKEQAIEAKQAEIKQLETQIYTAQKSLEKATTDIISPIDGVITSIPKEAGATVMAGTELVSIINPKVLKVTCDVSPYYAADLREGLDVEVKYTGSTTVNVMGKVTKVSPIAVARTGASGNTMAIPVEVEIKEPGDIIRPGFLVDAKITIDLRKNVTLVPILAVQEEENECYVYVVKEDGTLEKREVEQGLSDGLYVQVSNVTKGERVVSTIEDYIKEGMKVSYEKIGEEE